MTIRIDAVASKQTDRSTRRGRPPRLVAFGFLIAFAASVLTLLYTGLLTRRSGSAPEPRRGDQAAVAEARHHPPVGDTRTADDGSGSADRDTASRDGADAGAVSEATTSARDAGSRAPAD